MSPSVTPPALPHVLPAPPGQEQVRLIADGDRKLDDIVLWCRLGAVTGQGGHSGGSPDSTHTLGVRPLPRGFSAPPTLLPGGLEHDFGMVQKDGAAELQLQGEGHLGGLRWLWWGFGGGPKGLMGVSGVLPWPVSGRRGTRHYSAGGGPPVLSTPTSPCWDPARGTQWGPGHGVGGLGALGGGSSRPPQGDTGRPQWTNGT